MRLTIQQKIQAGFGLALVFLLITGVASWWSTRRNVETFHAVDHTYQVLEHLEETLVDLLNTETGVRGFAVSADPVFLEPYQAGIASVQKSFAAAKHLTQDNPHQQRRLEILETAIQKKISFQTEVVEFGRLGDIHSARQLIASKSGMQTMNGIRKLIGDLQAEERRLLELRTNRVKTLSRITILIVSLGSLVALALVGLASGIVRRDFHKRQQAEEERDRFFTLSLDLLCIAKGDYFFKRVNPAFTQTLGWSEEELLARPFLDFVHPDHREATLQEADRQIKRGEKVLRFVNLYQHKDGSWRWLSWNSIPQPDGLLYGTARDITQLRQVEEALRRSEENLAVTLHSIGDAVLATDASGCVTRLNPIAEKLTGWTEAEAQGRPVSEVFHIIHEETRLPAVVPVENVLATGQIHGLANATVIISRDGTERPIADSAAPIQDKEGRILGVVLVFRDVTEEKEADKALRESERRLRTLNDELEQRVAERTSEVRQALATLDATEDGAFIFDPETLRFSYVNEGAIRQLGYTREELLKKMVLEITPELNESLLSKTLASILQGKSRTRQFTTLHRHKDGHDIPVEINLQYVTPAGEKPRFICIAGDITERRKNEHLLHRSQRLESLGTLAGGVAHDLNNALAPIMMSVELLRMQYPGESELLDTIHVSAQRGAEMVRQLLTFAKGAEGQRVSIQPIHLINEMQGIMKGTFPKNIHVEVRYDKSLPTVLGDTTQLHQVVLNLCVNARDAMPQGGRLTLEAETQEVDAVYASSFPDARPGHYVVMRVRDTGTGIPPEILDRIFDPFFTTKGPDKGTGLGLSTVMGIVKGHGGFMQVYSPPGLGSTFAVFLPLDRGGVETVPAAQQASEFRGGGQTILLVEDEAAVRMIGQAVLLRLNFKPLTATDGADGLVQVAENRAILSAVIMDLHMPHMDGVNFARALRRMLPDIPVVVVSGRLDEMARQELEALGVKRHLAKPFTESQLAEVLKSIFAPT